MHTNSGRHKANASAHKNMLINGWNQQMWRSWTAENLLLIYVWVFFLQKYFSFVQLKWHFIFYYSLFDVLINSWAHLTTHYHYYPTPLWEPPQNSERQRISEGRWLCIQGRVRINFIPKSQDYQATSVGHSLAAYVLIMMWRVITIMRLCGCVNERQQGHHYYYYFLFFLFFSRRLYIPEGHLKELGVTAFWKCHKKQNKKKKIKRWPDNM